MSTNIGEKEIKDEKTKEKKVPAKRTSTVKKATSKTEKDVSKSNKKVKTADTKSAVKKVATKTKKTDEEKPVKIASVKSKKADDSVVEKTTKSTSPSTKSSTKTKTKTKTKTETKVTSANSKVAKTTSSKTKSKGEPKDTASRSKSKSEPKATASRSKSKSEPKTTASKTKATKTTTKKSTTKASKKAQETLEAPVQILEYYDLPYKYGNTIIKLLAQTPKTLFVYWEISDKDISLFQEKYGENFFNITVPILLVHNITLNKTSEIQINDFANCWYLNTDDANCKYEVELARKFIKSVAKPNKANVNDYLYITKSNKLDTPNDHILFEKLTEHIIFKNHETDEITVKNIKSFNFLSSIFEFYKNMYQNELLNNPSSNFFN